MTGGGKLDLGQNSILRIHHLSDYSPGDDAHECLFSVRSPDDSFGVVYLLYVEKKIAHMKEPKLMKWLFENIRRAMVVTSWGQA